MSDKFIVLGSGGPMWLSPKLDILYFGVRRGMIVSVFATKAQARSAIMRTVRYPPEETWRD